MKKIVVGLLALGLCASITACNTKQPNDASSAAPAIQTTTKADLSTSSAPPTTTATTAETTTAKAPPSKPTATAATTTRKTGTTTTTTVTVPLITQTTESTTEHTTTTATQETTATTSTTAYDSRPLILRMTNAVQRRYVDPVTNMGQYYYLLLPPDYDAQKSYPAMLYLHGAGERGFATQEPLQNMFYSLYGNEMKETFQNTIVVVPQCSTTGWWSLNTDINGVHRGELGTAMRLFEQMCTDYSVDRKRLYVMGLSMGGYGTWEVLTHFPDTFAAGIPICGWSSPSYAPILADIPIWVYHGEQDTTVSSEDSKEMVAAIRAVGGNKIHFTLHPTASHNVWQHAAKDTALFDWLFSQRKD